VPPLGTLRSTAYLQRPRISTFIRFVFSSRVNRVPRE
jgi:hypothetical protein